MRRLLPGLVAMLAGIVILVDMLWAPKWLGPWPSLLLETALVLGAVALLFGTAHLVATHVTRLASRQPQAAYSAVLVIALLATFGLGVAAPGSAALTWIFAYLYTPLQATMMGLMSFVLVTAIYRAGRLRQRGTLGLVLVALLALVLQAFASDQLSPLVPALRDWLLAVPVTAGARGLLLGIALGAAMAGLRVLCAVERPHTME